MEKYVKLEDVKALLNKLNSAPQYQYAGEIYYTPAAVAMELDSLNTIELEEQSPYAEWIPENESFLGSDYRCFACGRLADEGNSGHFNILTTFCKTSGRKMSVKEN